MQGGAADIVEQSLLKLDTEGFNDGIDSRILLQIHDEGVFEIREELVEEYSREIANSMANVNFHPRLETVKFKAVAKKWAS
jgi:DNA polymerase-1